MVFEWQISCVGSFYSFFNPVAPSCLDQPEPEVVVSPPNDASSSPEKKVSPPAVKVSSNGAPSDRKVTISSQPPQIKEEEELDWLRVDDDEFMELYTAMYNGKTYVEENSLYS